MEVYRVESDDLIRIPESELESEQALEEYLIRTDGAKIGGVDLMYIGRQEGAGEGGIFDILALDRQGNLVIVELKRDQAPRDIVTQALEYASSLRNSEYSDLEELYHSFLQQSGRINYTGEDPPALLDAHTEHFELGENELSQRDFNQDQRLLLVGEKFRDLSLNMADFLRKHDIDVVCVEYESFVPRDEGHKLLTTEAVRRPLKKEPSGESSDSEVTEGEELQEAFWTGVSEKIQSRDSPLTVKKPQSNTSMNYYTRFSQYDVVIQFSFKTRDEQLDSKFIVRDNAELYNRLYDDQSIKQELKHVNEENISWEGPTETRGALERGILKISRNIDPEAKEEWDEYQEWLIRSGEALKNTIEKRL